MSEHHVTMFGSRDLGLALDRLQDELEKTNRLVNRAIGFAAFSLSLSVVTLFFALLR